TTKLVVDRPAVVRIHERVVPKLTTLVEVRHAGRGVLHERLRERVDAGRGRDPGDERLELREEGRVGEQRINEAAESGFVLCVCGYPTGSYLGLAHGFFHVVAQAFPANGPRTDHCLVKKPLGT